MLATLETWARRVWVERDEAAIDEMLVPDTRAHGLGLQPLVGPEGFKAFHRTLCALLTDTELVIDHHIEADGWLAVLCTFKGTAADGRRVAIPGAIQARIAGGKLHEGYNHFDFLGFFSQLGLLPPDTFERCITGHPLGLDQASGRPGPSPQAQA
jgi:hypothetical protein